MISCIHDPRARERKIIPGIIVAFVAVICLCVLFLLLNDYLGFITDASVKDSVKPTSAVSMAVTIIISYQTILIF